MRWLPLVLALAAAPAASGDRAPPPPAHRGGGDPHRPFAESGTYIEHLERPDRAAWQRPDEVVAALRLRGDETVVDVGAGSGYFTFRLARALPRGKVVAVDVDPEMVRHVRRRAEEEGVANVQAVIAAAADPSVDPSADLVFACNVLHHVGDRDAWLGRLFAAMRPGARLVVLEFKEGKLPVGPPEAVKIPAARLGAMLRGAGFSLTTEDRELLPYQTFLVLEKPAAPRSGG
jgi:SAM-dependent methyltransferase